MLCFSTDSGGMQLKLGEIARCLERVERNLRTRVLNDKIMWNCHYNMPDFIWRGIFSFFIIHKIIAHPTIDGIFDVDEIL